MRILHIFTIACFICLSNVFVMAQQEDLLPPTEIKEVFKADFPTVLNAVKKTIKDNGCMIEDEKDPKITEEDLYKIVIRTNMCVYVVGEDSTLITMQRYSRAVPVIRAGRWVNGRIQYRIILNENKDRESTSLVLKSEMSGFEDYVTSKVHFWNSNGILENQFIEKLKANISSK